MAEGLAVTAKTVLLGGQQFTARTIPVARVKQVVPVLKSLFVGVQASEGEQASDTPITLETLVDKVLEAPHKLFALFIDDLPETVFTDPNNGATFPELLVAGKTILELNRLDTLKNAFSRLPMEFLGTLQQTSPSVSTN